MGHGPHFFLGVDVSPNLPAFEDLMEVTLGSVLHDDVEVFLIGKEFMEADDVRVA